LRELVADQARSEVARAARRIADDEANGVIRVALRANADGNAYKNEGPQRCHLPLNSGVRFSMNALRPSLWSSLAKQASTIFIAFARSRSFSSFSHCCTAYLAAATVSGAFSATSLQ